MASIRPRERAAIIQSLRAGVTPRVGLEYIQVGRVNEVKALIEDLENIKEGGSAFIKDLWPELSAYDRA